MRLRPRPGRPGSGCSSWNWSNPARREAPNRQRMAPFRSSGPAFPPLRMISRAGFSFPQRLQFITPRTRRSGRNNRGCRRRRPRPSGSRTRAPWSEAAGCKANGPRPPRGECAPRGRPRGCPGRPRPQADRPGRLPRGPHGKSFFVRAARFLAWDSQQSSDLLSGRPIETGP